MLTLSEYLNYKGKKRKEMVIRTEVTTVVRSNIGLVSIFRHPVNLVKNLGQFEQVTKQAKPKEIEEMKKTLSKAFGNDFFDLGDGDILLYRNEKDPMKVQNVIKKFEGLLVIVKYQAQ